LSSPRFDNPDRTYRPDIDGIRALAILSVILYHAGVPGIRGGFTGVDIFFVISGYLIGGHIYAELMAGNFSFLQFYRRRAKRILPAFYTVLAFVILASLFLLSPFEASKFGDSGIAATLSISNIYFYHSAGNYFAINSELHPLLMTWSLGVEEQFYAVIPILMVLLARFRRSVFLPVILAAGVLSFLLAWFEIGRNPNAAFFLLPARAWELGMGVALAVAELNRKRSLTPAPLAQIVSWTGLALMLAPMALLTTSSPFPGPAALSSVLGAALVIAAPSGWCNRKIFSLAPLVYIGRISYSWYLWHWPILSLSRILSGGKLPPAVIALAVAASFAAAVASYYLIEQPLRKSNLKAVPLLIRYAIVSLVALAACTAIYKSHGLPQRYPQVAQQENAIPGLWENLPCSTDSDTPNLSPQCYDPFTNRPSIALWGDSHAAALSSELGAMANSDGYNFVQLVKPACFPLSGAALFSPMNRSAAARCLRFNQHVLQLISADRNIKIVIIAGYWNSIVNLTSQVEWVREDTPNQSITTGPDQTQKIFMDALAASIRSLQASGKQVIVMDDSPNFDFNPFLRYSSIQIPLRRAIATRLGILNPGDSGFGSQKSLSSAAKATSLLQEIIASVPGASLFDLRRELCGESGQCIYRMEDQLFFRDSNHLTPNGTRYALRDFHLPPVATIEN
jgi:peptidoglycan/LPS O-acetylase OafA/YrhL